MNLSKKHLLWTIFSCVIFLSWASASHAGDEDNTITMKDRKFSPEELTVPAGQKVKLIVKNLDSAPMEFESYELNREKVIGAGGQAVVFIGPLKAGAYPYFDDFNLKAKGVIRAK